MTFLAVLQARLTEILAVAWIFVAARQILFWLYFIQIKQYRLDRLWLAVKEKSFLRLLASPFRLGVYALFLAWTIGLRLALVTSSGFSVLYYAVLAFYIAFALYQVALFLRGSLQLPKLTMKASAVFAIILSAETLLLSAYSLFWPEHVLALDILQPLIVFGIFALLQIPNRMLQYARKRAATMKRQKHANLRVIGITGSYGKTTMKEYVAHLLSSKFSVLKTPAHTNVDTGVADIVLKQLSAEHDIFVVEMGAYRMGEIKSICSIVQPQYAIMTALGNQHLELFGSRKALEKAKFELVDSVSSDAHIFANADSERLVDAFKRRDRRPVWYGLHSTLPAATPQMVAYKDGHTSFTLDGRAYKAPLFSSAAITNLVGAMHVARAFGLSADEIANALANLPKLEQNMELRSGKNACTLIDSSYNASTDGFLSALQDLALFADHRKVVVFKEIIELGEESKADHERIAAMIAKTADDIVLLPSQSRMIMVETLKTQGVAPEHIFDADTADNLTSVLDNRTVVLFMGRGGESLLKRWEA